jgi:hypothetical protein
MVTKGARDSSNYLYCTKCDYLATRVCDFNKHLQTKKHLRTVKSIHQCQCGKSYKYASGLSRHMLHCGPVQQGPVQQEPTAQCTDKLLTCECGKQYRHRQSLFTHKKKCKMRTQEMINSQNDHILHTKIVATLKEILPYIDSSTSNTVNINNTIVNNNNVSHNNVNHNNVTNNRISNNQINIFLHEKCGDAMSIQKFVERLTFNIDDLLLKRQESLTKVIQQSLAPLGLTERPVHCSNVARRKWHVNDESEGWKGDDGSTLVKSVEYGINKKWMNVYTKTTPDWSTQTEKRDEYVNIVSATTCNMPPKAEARILSDVGEKLLIDNEVIASLSMPT